MPTPIPVRIAASSTISRSIVSSSPGLGAFGAGDCTIPGEGRPVDGLAVPRAVARRQRQSRPPVAVPRVQMTVPLV